MQQINLKGSELKNSKNIPRWYKIGPTNLIMTYLGQFSWICGFLMLQILWAKYEILEPLSFFFNSIFPCRLQWIFIWDHPWKTLPFSPIFWQPLPQIDIFLVASVSKFLTYFDPSPLQNCRRILWVDLFFDWYLLDIGLVQQTSK